MFLTSSVLLSWNLLVWAKHHFAPYPPHPFSISRLCNLHHCSSILSWGGVYTQDDFGAQELEQSLCFFFPLMVWPVFELGSLGADAQTCHGTPRPCPNPCLVLWRDVTCSTLADEKVSQLGNVNQNWVCCRTGKPDHQLLTDHPIIFCVQLLCKMTFIRRKAISCDKCSRQRIWVTDCSRVRIKWLWCFALHGTQWEMRPRGCCLFWSLNVTKLWQSLLKLLSFSSRLSFVPLNPF